MASKTVAQAKTALDNLEMARSWGCEQIEAAVAGALSLLPDEEAIYRGPALADRFSRGVSEPTPEQTARLQLAHALSNVRKLLEGIEYHNSVLSNEIDCHVEDVREALGCETSEA